MRRHRLQSASTLVETALVLPIIVLVLLGIIEYSRYYYVQTVLANAAREGARYGIINPTDTAGITSAAQRYTVGVGSAAVGVSVTTPNGTGHGQPINVYVSYTTRVFIPYPFGKNLQIVRQATMQIE